MNELVYKGQKAKEASLLLANLSSGEKNDALKAIAGLLMDRKGEILEANAHDVQRARNKNTPLALIDRLSLDASRIEAMAGGLLGISALPDPVGEVVYMRKRSNGLQIGKQRVPIGVIGMIYEARPNVTTDVAGLCLKTGNAVILRGGSEAISSNKAIVAIINEALKDMSFPEGTVHLIEDTSRGTVNQMMKMNKYIDVLIPRGGASLIQTVIQNSTIPVIQTGSGNCHIYVDENASPIMAEDIIINAKTSRPGVCNAAETLLVHRTIAPAVLPGVLKRLKNMNVEVRGCEETRAMAADIKMATEKDWRTEYLDYILAIKIVKGIDEAIEHVSRYGTGHSEAIITSDYGNAQRFLKEVDAAVVYVNASTRFTDGEEFGFGSEIGISTQKLHARGPMGLNELTSFKYIVYGNGQIR